MTSNVVSQHEVDARDRFDDWSDSDTFRRLRPWLAYVQGYVLDQIDWTNARAVLDVACGSGWAVYEAARRLRPHGGHAYGCDLSEGMLKQRAAPPPDLDNTHFLNASAQSLPYGDSAFDAMICTVAFHHFPEPLEALREFRRVLRPGGTLVIADTCRDLALGNWIWDRLHRWFEKGHVEAYRTADLLSLIQQEGFVGSAWHELSPSYRETKKLVGKVGVFTATAPEAH